MERANDHPFWPSGLVRPKPGRRCVRRNQPKAGRPTCANVFAEMTLDFNENNPQSYPLLLSLSLTLSPSPLGFLIIRAHQPLATPRAMVRLRLTLPRYTGQQSEVPTKGVGRRAPQRQDETLGAD